MDVDCRRPRHDENYSSLFVENSHPETLHRDMCIACSGSSSGLRLPPLRTMPIHKIVSKERCQSYFIDGCRRIKIERNNLLCEQAPTEVFRSIFAWLVARLTFNYSQYSNNSNGWAIIASAWPSSSSLRLRKPQRTPTVKAPAALPVFISVAVSPM